MKTPSKFLAILAIAALAMGGCKKFNQTKVYTANTPVYMSYDDLRESVANDDSRALLKPGKIFLYDQYILINDFETGVHVYDNSNPSNPQHVAFVNIPGNVDIAVKDNTLFVDSYIDLVAIDISDPKNVREVGRNQDVFSYTVPSTMNYNYPVAQVDQTKGVIVGYEVKEIEESCKNDDCGYMYQDAVAVQYGDWDGYWMSEEGTVVSFGGNSNNVRSVSQSNTSGALAGSMARFILVGQYLYAISDGSTIKVFDISSSQMPEVASFNPLSDGGNIGNIETIFSLNDNLFIGSTTGVLIYDISSGSNPTYVSTYTHLTGCDPVVANENHAFLTLRSGSQCGTQDIDMVEVLDISNIQSPYSVATYNMTEPKGLSLDNGSNVLFVCDGSAGMKVFDISDATQLREIGSASGETYDVIAHRNVAHVISNNGLVQYSYDQNGVMTELSRIDLN
ncbi:MAG: hypothetical protein R2813_01485 [Flavobacteriales bacterium]